MKNAKIKTPTLKVVGSNPVGRTTKETSFVYQDMRGFLFV